MPERDKKSIGQVRAIFLYPVKSMRGISMQEASIDWNGLIGDRAYAFVRAEARSDFPWLTGRQFSHLIMYRPFFQSGSRRPSLQVETAEGNIYPIDSPALREEIESRYGKHIYLLQNHRGNYDSQPLSILTTSSIAKLSELTGLELDVQRFRPNLLIETAAPESFQEDAWIGHRLRFGAQSTGVCLDINQGIDRCVMINLDPQAAVSTPDVLKQVYQNHQNIFGVYATPHTPGMVRIGDPVYLDIS